MDVKSFRDLDAWKVAMDLVEDVYGIVRSLPASERFELSSQIRRAAVSIPSNIAEGHAVGLPGRFRHHARLALGSVAELSTQLELACRLGYLAPADRNRVESELLRVRHLLGGIVRSMTRKLATACLSVAIGIALLV